MIENFMSHWCEDESFAWIIAASIVVGIAIPLLLLWWSEWRERRWWKAFHERHGILLTDVKLYDVELTAEQIKYLSDMGPPHRTISGRNR